MKWQLFLPKFSEFPRNDLPRIQLFSEVSCGFPSPAQDYLDKCLDLNEFLIKRPSATFMVRAQGDSMIGAGIFPKDLLVIDRSVSVKSGDIVLAV